MFERSPYGVQNRALFLRVKYVIYAEGDPQGDINQSPDRAFWTRIIKLFRPDLSFTILVKGGKKDVLQFASYIVSNNISGTAAVLDCDYDDLCGTMITDRRVIYTHGYSWENDVVNSKVCTGIIKHILFASAPRRTAKTLAVHDLIVRRFRWLSVADQIGVRNNQGIVSRKGFRKHVNVDEQGQFCCAMEHKQPIAQLRAIKGRHLQSIGVDRNVHRRLFGKLYLHILLLVLRRDVVPAKRKFSDDEFFSALFNVFNQISTRDLPRAIRTHYKGALAGL
ncbi:MULTISPECIES: DUF4435 domain-containing protein [unclassified Bradyrhizobium]|uniref:DUF4435 domain-containing protein n=1 Tax=unclassified Bradyrhizobium TaxID=2631580 RepID=UPI001FF71B62|nr:MULTISPECIES: DUF4435 domain-containing protein [unclassified Bradyrhizobium]MCK1536447.1 hypothetical protein [Bradyrhizobium sp. 176]MCK1556516.1 hypothetical protein [Bradyrhizobium sp. 171]